MTAQRQRAFKNMLHTSPIRGLGVQSLELACEALSSSSLSQE